MTDAELESAFDQHKEVSASDPGLSVLVPFYDRAVMYRAECSELLLHQTTSVPFGAPAPDGADLVFQRQDQLQQVNGDRRLRDNVREGGTGSG